MTRRDMLLGAAALMIGGQIPVTAQDEPIVETASGRLRGTRVGDVYLFKGVPYGASTGGEGRFRPPRPPLPWSGVRDASKFGASAPQTNPHPPQGASRIILGHLRPANAPPPGGRPPEGEDCLVLNIWTSGLSDGRKRPVVVRLHGGFFAAGSGSGIDGSPLAARGDVVVVSVNHRLNAFGFSHFGDIGGADWAHSGNLGMLDIIAALEWVRDHIDRFGGDPRRVMVFGESGGGMKTSFLLGSPPAVRLFHRAGIESGAGLRFMERDAASRASDLLLTELGLTPKRLDDIRAVPVDQVLAAYFAVMAKLPPANFSELPGFAPVLDPVFLPAHPFSPRASALSAEIPLLAGWNRTEMTFFMGNDPDGFTLDESGLKTRLSRFFGEETEEVIALYRKARPDASPSDLYIAAWSDYSIGVPMILQAERKAALRKAPVYLYRFDFASPALEGKLGTPHTLEVPFIFNTVDEAAVLTGGSGQAHGLAAQMSDAWVSFATSGDPNSVTGTLPPWPAYDTQGRATMILNSASHVESDPGREKRALLARLLVASKAA